MIAVNFERGVDESRHNEFAASRKHNEAALATAKLAGNLHRQIRAEFELAILEYQEGNSDSAEAAARASIELARANQMESLAMQGIVSLANLYAWKGDFENAEKSLNQVLAFAMRNDQTHLAAVAQLSLAGTISPRPIGIRVFAASFQSRS